MPRKRLTSWWKLSGGTEQDAQGSRQAAPSQPHTILPGGMSDQATIANDLRYLALMCRGPDEPEGISRPVSDGAALATERRGV
jgi:hypothetical protein